MLPDPVSVGLIATDRSAVEIAMLMMLSMANILLMLMRRRVGGTNLVEVKANDLPDALATEAERNSGRGRCASGYCFQVDQKGIHSTLLQVEN